MADSSDLEDDDYLEEEGDLEADSDSPASAYPVVCACPECGGKGLVLGGGQCPSCGGSGCAEKNLRLSQTDRACGHCFRPSRPEFMALPTFLCGGIASN